MSTLRESVNAVRRHIPDPSRPKNGRAEAVVNPYITVAQPVAGQQQVRASITPLLRLVDKLARELPRNLDIAILRQNLQRHAREIAKVAACDCAPGQPLSTLVHPLIPRKKDWAAIKRRQRAKRRLAKPPATP
jgi:hypothetical protein